MGEEADKLAAMQAFQRIGTIVTSAIGDIPFVLAFQHHPDHPVDVMSSVLTAEGAVALLDQARERLTSPGETIRLTNPSDLN